MTEGELARFALVLEECKRIRAMTAEDEEAAALANDSSGGIPIVAAPEGGTGARARDNRRCLTSLVRLSAYRV